MGLATHLGPWLVGTIKNPSNTSSTISTSGIGTYRNTGATVAMQTSVGGVSYSTTSITTLSTPGNVVQAIAGTTTSSTAMVLSGTTAAAEGIVAGQTVVGPGIAPSTLVVSTSGSAVTLSANAVLGATAPAPFVFYSNTPSNVDPVVLPAGSIITGVFVDVLTAWAAAGAATIVISVANPTATYPIGTIAYTSSLSGGRYALGGSSIFTSTAIGSMILTNISSGQNNSTDALLQAQVTGSPTAGLASVTIQYAVCNPDGTYFPQTPGQYVVAAY